MKKVYFPDKTCAQCGSLFNRRVSKSGRMENTKDFLDRKYCSHECYTSHHQGVNHSLYNPNGSKRYDGYIRISIAGKRLYKHRYVMECHLGRLLGDDEHVHHRDGNPENNNISNLVLTNNSQHLKLHYQHRKIDENGRFTKG